MDPHPHTTPGFGHSRGRIALEIGALVGGVVLIAGGVIWGAGAMAGALVPFVPTSVDVKIGEPSWQSPDLAQSRCPNPAPLDYVNRISAPLLAEIKGSPFSFQFQVVANDEINAFALPGGFVTVNMGLLEHAKTGEEVAAVIAHEIQHVLLRHSTRRILRRMGGSALLSWVFSGTSIEAPTYLLGELASLRYDRAEETEADQGGLALLKAAHIDPRGMSRFFARLEHVTGSNPPTLLSTHPDPGDRAHRAEEAARGGGPWQALPAPSGLHCD